MTGFRSVSGPRYGVPMGALTLEELSATTIVAANALSLKPGQEQFIAPLTYSVVAAVHNPASTWQRVVLDDGVVVGFVSGNFDPDSMVADFASILWRINVDADAQGHGIGTFAVEALGAEAKRRGFAVLNVIYEPGADGPEAFFQRVGFVPQKETEYGEVLASLPL